MITPNDTERALVPYEDFSKSASALKRFLTRLNLNLDRFFRERMQNFLFLFALSVIGLFVGSLYSARTGTSLSWNVLSLLSLRLFPVVFFAGFTAFGMILSPLYPAVLSFLLGMTIDPANFSTFGSFCSLGIFLPLFSLDFAFSGLLFRFSHSSFASLRASLKTKECLRLVIFSMIQFVFHLVVDNFF